MSSPQQAEAFSSIQHAHRFFPSEAKDEPVLLLLHGTGGDETQMLPLGRELKPDAALLSVRGRVLEGRAPRFFRRFGEGILDLDDWRKRTAELAEFVRDAVAHYKLEDRPLIAVGFSNGANIATGLLLLETDLLSGAILFRPMFVDRPASLPDLGKVPVLIGSGRQDPLVTEESAESLAKLLRDCKAQVELRWSNSHHGLAPEEVPYAAQWLERALAHPTA